MRYAKFHVPGSVFADLAFTAALRPSVICSASRRVNVSWPLMESCKLNDIDCLIEITLVAHRHAL